MVSASVVHTVGRAELHERRVLDPPRCGQAGATAGGLHEADLGVPALGCLVQVGQLHRLERGPQLGQVHGRRAHEAAARVAGVDDAAVLDLDPGRQPVGEAEPAGGPPRLEVVDGVGRRFVVAA